MELLMAFGNVVSGNSFYMDIIHLQLVAILHSLAITNHSCTTGIGDELGFVVSEGGNGLFVEMITMLMSHEDIVGFGHSCVIYRSVSKFPNRINLNFLTLKNDAYARMHESIELDSFTAFCCEGVNLFRFGCHFLTSFLPCENTAFQINYLKSVFCKNTCRMGRTAPTTAINCHFTILV